MVFFIENCGVVLCRKVLSCIVLTTIEENHILALYFVNPKGVLDIQTNCSISFLLKNDKRPK